MAYVKETVQTTTDKPYEIYYIKKHSEIIESKDNSIDGYEIATTEGIAVRILSANKMGFSYTTQLDRDSILKTVHKALEGLEVADEDDAYEFLDPSTPYPTLAIHDSTLVDLATEKKKEMVLSIETAARQYDSRIKQIRNAQLSFHQAHVWLLNSFELERFYTASGVSATIILTAEENGMSEFGWESFSSHFLADIQPEEIGKNAAQKAITRLGGKPVPGGTFPTILDREVVAEIVQLLSSSFTGENIYKGKSTLKGKEGQEIFSPCLNLSDGLLFEEGMAAAPFDGEGEPAQKTTLIDHGVVAGFLYDHYYAKKMKATSTANAIRGGISLPPMCGTTNLYLDPGKVSLKEMIRDISKGFYIQELMGLHTANTITGEFSLGASGQWIEKGELTYPVRGVAVSGNLFELLKNVEVVGSDVRWFGSTAAPSLLVGSLSLAGTEK